MNRRISLDLNIVTSIQFGRLDGLQKKCEAMSGPGLVLALGQPESIRVYENENKHRTWARPECVPVTGNILLLLLRRRML